jgi:hypothetical protein
MFTSWHSRNVGNSKGQITPSCSVICTCIGAMGAHYWPILACGTRVRVTTRYSEKFKINISSPPYSNETFHTKALEYKWYFTPIDLFWRVQRVFNFFLHMKYRMFGQAVSKYTIVLVCVLMLWRHLTHRSKGYLMRISTVVFVLKGGKILAEIF